MQALSTAEIFSVRGWKKRLSSRNWWGVGRHVATPSHRQVYSARGGGGWDGNHIAKENKAGYTKFSASSLIFSPLRLVLKTVHENFSYHLNSFTPRLSYGEMTRHFHLYLWTLLLCAHAPPPGRVITAQKGYLFSLQVNETLGISLVKVYEWVGKYVISSVKRLIKMANRCILRQWKSWENVLGFVVYLYFKHSAFTIVEKGAKF